MFIQSPIFTSNLYVYEIQTLTCLRFNLKNFNTKIYIYKCIYQCLIRSDLKVGFKNSSNISITNINRSVYGIFECIWHIFFNFLLRNICNWQLVGHQPSSFENHQILTNFWAHFSAQNFHPNQQNFLLEVEFFTKKIPWKLADYWPFTIDQVKMAWNFDWNMMEPKVQLHSNWNSRVERQ